MERAEIYRERCGKLDNGRVKTWLPYRWSYSEAHLLHDVTQERLLGDQADKYYISWFQVPQVSVAPHQSGVLSLAEIKPEIQMWLTPALLLCHKYTA